MFFLLLTKYEPVFIQNTSQRANRIVKGMKKCAKPCTACPFIKGTKEVKIDSGNTWKINKKMNCNTYNIIYLLECQKSQCMQRYIGTTG